MRSIKVLATDSTNLFLRELYRENPLTENCYVSTEHQTKGKGQMGAGWKSKPGKNLTFSILINKLHLELTDQFKLSAIVAVAVVKALQKLGIYGTKVKWPNDILADNHKICGILIENILTKGRVSSSIIGIGLNVNQVEFANLPRASSLKKLTGITYNLEEVLQTLVAEIETRVYAEKKLPVQTIFRTYEDYLFRLKKPSMFAFPSGEKRPGIIQKITSQGRLQVLFEDSLLEDFDIKEIKLLY